MPESFFSAGKYYERGLGVTENPAKAVDCYDPVAAGGGSEASLRFGFIFLEGRGDTQRDLPRATAHFINAEDINGIYQVGRACTSGEDATTGFATGIELLKRAASGGSLGAMIALAYLYKDSLNLEKRLKSSSSFLWTSG